MLRVISLHGDLLGSGERIPNDQYDRVAAQKHFRYEAVLVDRLGLLLALARLGYLSPHFLYIFKHQIKMPLIE